MKQPAFQLARERFTFHASRFTLHARRFTFCAATLLLALTASAQVRPNAKHAPLGDYDKRSAAAMTPAENARRAQGLAHAKGLLDSTSVSFDELLGTPKFILSRDGFLTGPNGQGRGVSKAAAQGFAANDPDLPIKAFLNEHSALFGHGSEVLDAGSAIKQRDSVTPHNGLRTVVWHQQLDGVPVFESVLIGNITKKGELASVSSHFLPNAAHLADVGTPNRAALRAAPAVSAQDAIVRAAAELGETWSTGEISASTSTAGYLVFNAPRPAYVRQVWLPLDSGRLRLAWEVMLDSRQSHLRYQVLIDAQTGSAWLRRSMTAFISDATYNVWTSDSPSPFSPGWPTPNTAQPPLTNRFMVVTPALDTNASPEGWIPDGGNTTTGNNADAFLDRNFDQQPDQPRPVGNPARVFDFPQDLTQDPKTYVDASTVQMFYWMNYHHDRLYQLGFTEAAGNYQDNNFGRGGIGGDHIIGYVQAGADVGLTDNAFFQGAPDGINGQVFMFTWSSPNPNRDGSLDTDVLLHELTHGVSMRLVGGGVGISALQTAGMGEGWSDFFAISLASEATDDPDAVYASGGYVGYQFGGQNFANYYFGLRHYPYCADMSKDPFTFKDIDPTQILPHTGIPFSPIYSPFNAQEASEVHHQGEVWCVTLWDCRANLIHKYGYAGNQLMLKIVIDGMKLSPANPTYMEARDAIILADRVDNAGVDVIDLWQGFAKRGMGASAVAPPANTTTGVVEAYDLPGLSIDTVTLSGGNGNGTVDPNECNILTIGLFNNNASAETSISARLSTTTPGVIVAGPVSAYPDIPSGRTNVNLTPFKISTSPDFVCGTPVDLALVIKSDQETRTNRFQLSSGILGTPLRFDNNTPVAIPDNNPVGASSIITVANFPAALSKVTVAIHITHTFDSDLLIELVSPDGVTNILSANEGGGGNDYGTSCIPDGSRTVFDDAATTPISAGNPPFVGTFQPESPLSRFNGKIGTGVNGNWQLHVIDQAAIDVGTIQCWSLFLSPAACTDGGGQCPGVDLAIGMTAAPEPVFVGSNLVYSISVTNFGPNTAKNSVISEILPQGVVFVSASISQGSISQSGGVVTGNFGNMPVGARATAQIVVTPLNPGLVVATASVSSTDPDNDPSNNSVTVISHVNPPFSDLVAGISAIPNPVLVGQTLTYTAVVTNNGPATASTVTLTNVLPASVGIINASASQGFATVSGNMVVANFGSVATVGKATVTIQVIPTLEGLISASATAAASQTDPVPGNNNASVDVIVGPSSDLALGLTANPISIVPGTNVIYTLRVTNRGPSTATGVLISDSLPAGVTVISTNSSKGSTIFSVSGSTVTASMASLTNGETATVTIGVSTVGIPFGTIVNSATVAADQTDPNTANNNASASVLVSAPHVQFAIDRARINSESIAPTNGTLDPGETVSVSFFIQNNGNVVNTGSGLLVTLLATNGVTSPSGTQNYGNIAPSAVQNHAFTFTADPNASSTVVATFLLQDPSGTNLLTYTFYLPTTQTFANTNRIDIPTTAQNQQLPGPASPYPSPITVSGVTGIVNRVTVTLSNLNHTFPHDIDLLLVGPTGVKTLLMSAAADASSVSSANVTFDDSASSPMPSSGQIFSGSYQPSGYDPSPAFTNPAPAAPYGNTLSAYNAPDPNGSWALYVQDVGSGDFGYVGGGWSLSFSTVVPVNQIADLVTTGSSSVSTLFAGDIVTNTFTVTNAGPNGVVNASFSSTLPPNSTFVSASTSLGGSLTPSGGVISSSLGTLLPGNSAVKVTIAFIPNAPGSFVNTATVSAVSGEVDLTLPNNSVSQVVTAVQPAADLSVSSSDAPNPVTIGSNLVVSVAVTNNGPNTALNVVVSNALPAGASLTSSNVSQGSIAKQGSALIASLGAIAPSNWATLNFTLVPSAQGQLTNAATVSTDSADTNSANNVATTITTVVKPSPAILAAGAAITAETIHNATIDAGETVTVSLTLTNAGVAGSTNLTATLLAINGVNSPSGPQNYGTLLPGASAARAFTFTAGSTSPILATLQVSDAAGYSSQVVFTFSLPNTTSFTNPLAIIIPDHGPAVPYPSAISVSGLTGVVDKVTVSLNGVTHTFPHDINALLVSPAGQKVGLVSHCGGGHPVTNVNLTIDDSALIGLSSSGQIVSGTFKPSVFDPAVSYPSTPAGPVANNLASFNGIAPNGTWSLYVIDDSVGDAGQIAGGWTLSITTIVPVNPAVNLVLGLTAAPDPVLVGNILTYTFTLTNRGPSTATNVVLTAHLPAGVTLTSSNTTLGTLSAVGTTVTVTNVTLAPSAGLVTTLRVAPTVAGPIVTTATATCAQTDLDPLSNSAQVSTTVVSPVAATLTIVPVAGGQFQITLSGDPGVAYSLQGSSNLFNWVAVATGTAAPSGTFKYTTTNANSFNYRFYRSVRLP
jgi:uncharacterized repeat protein (TIGR01451 family)